MGCAATMTRRRRCWTMWGLVRRFRPACRGAVFAAALRWEAAPAHAHIVIYDEYGPVRMIRLAQWKYVHRYPYGPHEL